MSDSEFLARVLSSAKRDAPTNGSKARALQAIANAPIATTTAIASKTSGSAIAMIALTTVAIAAGGVAYTLRSHVPATIHDRIIASQSLTTTTSPNVPSSRPSHPERLAPLLPSPNVEADRCEGIALEDKPPTDCSTHGDGLLMELVNTCSATTVDVYWVNFECKERFYKQLAPGETWQQATFATHPWRVRDHATHRLLKEIAKSGPALTWPIADAGKSDGGQATIEFEILPGPPIQEASKPHCSEASLPTEIDVFNRRADAVEMYWLDYDCKEIFKGRIEPGDHFPQRTYAAHRWHVREEGTHDLVKDFAVDPSPSAQRAYVTVP